MKAIEDRRPPLLRREQAVRPWCPSRDADLVRLVGQLRADPGDQASRLVLADLLDEHGPTPAEYGSLPSWLRLCWLRSVPSPGPAGAGRPAAWAVGLEIGAFLGSAWDHWGRTRLGPWEVLASEPYRPGQPDEGLLLLAPLAAAMPGTAAAGARLGGWAAGTVRGILFPPAQMPPPRRRKGAQP